jgi:catechol 2,3-dioxygenase-like lactoylglutathione lyase family enzyme
VRPRTLDHVALWVPDRDAISEFALRYLGMHVIESTDRFTLIGSDARHGKLTLFAAEGPRARGALKHVALRVRDLEEALRALPDGRRSPQLEVGEGLHLRLVEAETDVDYDLDHVALYSSRPDQTAVEYLELGFAEAGPSPSGAPRVEVGGAFVEFHRGDPRDGDRPLLNHLAVLVDSADEHIERARELGVEIADVVDAPNTYAVFVWGPERVKIEYVEHKPSFSLT